ncbi:MAG: homoserine dehydrogenase, partial [Bacteroidetes bacterium]|nr:homoserine dehydrogenase [Bacteroidota bacterium]
YIPRENFEWIEEWHAGEQRKYLVGVLSFNQLKNNDWWRKHNNSLILLPDPVIENIEIKKLKKKSLELAGLI